MKNITNREIKEVLDAILKELQAQRKQKENDYLEEIRKALDKKDKEYVPYPYPYVPYYPTCPTTPSPYPPSYPWVTWCNVPTDSYTYRVSSNDPNITLTSN